jgi:carboxymethylenebutenolidase
MLAETVRINGHNGDEIDAYLARPLGPGPYGSVVLIHHMPGWDDASKEMARKLAYNGFVTISPDLHYRQRQESGLGYDHAKLSAYVRDQGGMPDDRTLGDVQGAMNYLRSLPYANGKVGVIGFCSGGRQTFLVACRIPTVDAAVDCWGGGVIARPGELTPAMPVAPIDYTKDLKCPLLGLFGNEDQRPTAAEVNAHEAELKRLGKKYEFHRYDNAGHGFFAVDRPSYRQEAATDGWQKVIAFFNQNLQASATNGARARGARAAAGTARR